MDVSSYYLRPQPSETTEFIMQQTMIRVKSPKPSLDFYCNILGMNLVYHVHYEKWGFSLYFVAFCDSAKIPDIDVSKKEGCDEMKKFCFKLPGCIEITHNHGSENEEGKVYNTGNSDNVGVPGGEKVKGGFGHIGITVPDVYKACERFHKLGVEFHKSPNQGGMKGIAFVKDPDGYLVEILPIGDFKQQEIDCLGVKIDQGVYKDNSK